jgi:metallo-beta-lactamase family protein
MMRIHFLGAAGNVTGSRYWLDAPDGQCLVDCGLVQERALQTRNWDPFPVPPASLQAVLLTHAHLDHCGYLPRLVRDGFKGRIFCTAPTAELARLVLLDSARLQTEDAAFKRKRHVREGRKGPYPEEPLYQVADVEATVTRFQTVDYHQPVPVGPGMKATFFDAGHILGSALIRIDCALQGHPRRLLFSGDIGRQGRPLLENPELASVADYIQIESTYGDRLHDDTKPIPERLAAEIRATYHRGGILLMPSFAIERAQEILYHLRELFESGAIPRMKVFLDSPMAIEATGVFRRHVDLLDTAAQALFREGRSPFDFRELHYIRTSDESKALNQLREPAIIIAGAGMCTGGRIKHHLLNHIGKPTTTVLFIGYQSVGTLGRIIQDGAPEVRIHGQMCPVRAHIETIHGFSGHADRAELLRWIAGLPQAPRGVFVTHGEPESAQSFAEYLRQETGWPVTVPAYGDVVELD